VTRSIEIDPLTRIEGHLAFKVETEEGRVKEAFLSGEMFRGIEVLLKGRDPLDAQQVTQRICGVCSAEHGIASVLAQDMAYGVEPPPNGRLVRNIIGAANFIQSHIVHFYQLAALDFVDVTAVLGYGGRDPSLCSLKRWVQSEVASGSPLAAAPFLPRYEGKYIADAELNLGATRHYLEALEMRALGHRLGAVFAGKLPHAASLVPGGVTESVTADRIAACGAMLGKLRAFIETAYIPDVLAVAAAFPEYFTIGRWNASFLAYGVFPESSGARDPFLPAGTVVRGEARPLDPERITEDVGRSRFSSPSGLAPSRGETRPAPEKAGAYSWLKAPRYGGAPMEVGPLARILVAISQGKLPEAKKAVEEVLKALGKTPEDLVSVMGRHAARAIECRLIADKCARWIEMLRPGEPTVAEFRIPEEGRGRGLTEAARGALGHWIEIRGRKVEAYQCVVPTTWNCSPRDDRGQPGPVEQALVGTPIADPSNPIEAARVVRSFDPCIACAVH